MENTLVSILLITMNHEKFIEQAVLSAINQGYPNLEIIFLDNNSVDHTYEIAERTFQNSKIPHQLIRNKENHGVSKNLNIMLSFATGKYVAILSGDDWWKENLITEKVAFIGLGYDFVLSDGYKYLEETGETIPVYTQKEKDKIINTLPRFFKENVVANKTANVGTFIKRDLLVKHPFDENINTEDWDMNLRMTHLGYKLGFIDQKLFYYRILPSSLSRKWDVMEESYHKVTSKYLDYIKTDKTLYKKYLLQKLMFKYEILLSKIDHDSEKKQMIKTWRTEKIRIKYKQPIQFFKIILNRFS